MRTSTETVTFRIDIFFDDADVDMVYNEAVADGFQGMVPSFLTAGAKPHKIDQNSKTPIGATVDFALHWLAGYVDRNEMCTTTSKWERDYTAKPITAYTECGMAYTTFPKVQTELEILGIDVVEWNGLMMGNASLECEVPKSKYSKKLVKEANAVVEEVMSKLVVYYKTKATKKVA